MKQLTIDILTSILVLLNLFTGILGFAPSIIYANPLLNFIPFSPVYLSIGLMIVGIILDVFMHKSVIGSLFVTAILGFAYWTITPNILLVAVFTGVIIFGQLMLKE